MKHTWWKESVVYQVYPRSFRDSNGDGIGDLNGVLEKLDYLQDLGVDVIWLCPMYQSPNDDNGYDISDYQAIMQEFGTMADFDALLAAVHARGMKLILDLVVNHTSDEHAWFLESRASKDSPKRDWYIWRDGVEGKPPNNWESIFSGSAWAYDKGTNQYYLHLFSTKQPDLNWEHPDVRRAVYDMMNWWLDKGIDGFRVDAISHIKKTAGLPDMPNPFGQEVVSCFPHMMNVPGIDAFLSELKQETLDHYDVMTVGEANGVNLEDAPKWVGEDGYFNMIFQFEHLGLWDKGVGGTLDVHALRATLSKWQNGLENKGWNALFLENHDQPRSVSTWGDDTTFHRESATSLATMFFFMKGTPYIYQGQEIGMTNVAFPRIEDYNDVGMINYYHLERARGRTHEEIMPVIWQRGRDNSRTPMQWDDSLHAGFSSAPATWMGVNPNYRRINVAAQQRDPFSILNFYKRMIALRKTHAALIHGTYAAVIERHDEVYGYTRTYGDEIMLVLANLSSKETPVFLPDNLLNRSASLLLSNYAVPLPDPFRHIQMRPYESRIYRLTPQ